MTKVIFKEIAIVLLLIVSIGLILTIAFYDYMPISKVVPCKVVAYEIENEVQEEINNSSLNSTQNIIKTYIIDETDLSAYESSDSYDKGKENPFSATGSSYIPMQTNNSSGTSGVANNETKATYSGK